MIARFTRASADPLRVDPNSRFDLVWPTGEAFIRQPFTNHNGGQLAFGPDGFLYIGLGDGGSGNDPMHLAQNPQSLLGKMLRIDVSVPASDPQGYDVPPGNPFAGRSDVRGEIWSFGLRNPWRFSFDAPRGGTGALIMGDVGQGAWEEVDYEPAGTGGRNYGWRNREGAHDNVTSLPPFSQPLRDPIWIRARRGRSITGGYVYRGTSLGTVYAVDTSLPISFPASLVGRPDGRIRRRAKRQRGPRSRTPRIWRRPPRRRRASASTLPASSTSSATTDVCTGSTVTGPRRLRRVGAAGPDRASARPCRDAAEGRVAASIARFIGHPQGGLKARGYLKLPGSAADGRSGVTRSNFLFPARPAAMALLLLIPTPMDNGPKVTSTNRTPSPRVQSIAILIALALALVASWMVIAPFFSVLAWAVVMTVLFYPVHRRLERLLKRPAWAAAASSLLVIVTVLLPAILIATATVGEVRSMAAGMPTTIEGWVDPANPRTGTAVRAIERYVSLDRLRDPEVIKSSISNWGLGLAGGSLRVVGSAASVIVQMALTVFIMFFLFKDARLIRTGYYHLLPIENQRLQTMLVRIRDVITASVHGTLLIAIVQGALGGVAFAVLGLPAPFLWGTVMALASIIPMLGAFIVWVPAAIFLLLHRPSVAGRRAHRLGLGGHRSLGQRAPAADGGQPDRHARAAGPVRRARRYHALRPAGHRHGAGDLRDRARADRRVARGRRSGHSG